MKNSVKIFFLIIIAMGFGVFVDQKFIYGSGRQPSLSVLEDRKGGGVLTNPLLQCIGVGDEEHVEQLNISKFELNDYVNDILKKGKVKFLSVYVRDMNNGPWVGINEKEEFIGASLLKVPLFISYMKLAEKDPSILDKKLDYTKKLVDYEQYFGSGDEIKVGNTYTVAELLERMIRYSDNNAGSLLASQLTQQEIDETFTAIGLGSPSFGTNYPVNTKTYAGFFRILFNASYLSKEKSEFTLDLLTQTAFDKGLTLNLPKDIKVAHKFGIRTSAGVNQLHDCGIVYYPEHPYLLCIMSRGGEFADLSDVIANISGFIYKQVTTSVK